MKLEDSFFCLGVKKMCLGHIKYELEVLIGRRRILIADPCNKIITAGSKIDKNL